MRSCRSFERRERMVAGLPRHVGLAARPQEHRLDDLDRHYHLQPANGYDGPRSIDSIRYNRLYLRAYGFLTVLGVGHPLLAEFGPPLTVSLGLLPCAVIPRILDIRPHNTSQLEGSEDALAQMRNMRSARTTASAAAASSQKHDLLAYCYPSLGSPAVASLCHAPRFPASFGLRTMPSLPTSWMDGERRLQCRQPVAPPAGCVSSSAYARYPQEATKLALLYPRPTHRSCAPSLRRSYFLLPTHVDLTDVPDGRIPSTGIPPSLACRRYSSRRRRRTHTPPFPLTVLDVWLGSCWLQSGFLGATRAPIFLSKEKAGGTAEEPEA
ncbi:hypothetical protein C8R46DRAFT_1307908 [Mycena filopes]|nr:hypothetical protein C8R46DRAFT_1307908 [Mycena filopes]